MDKGVVNVIIPCYNGSRYLSQSIDSALAQTYCPLRVLVVDDGSVDGTRAVVESYGGEVEYYYQSNQGQAAARNQGIARTTGEYVCLLDADDILLPDMVSTHVNYLEHRPECDFCHSKTLAFDHDSVMHAYAESWRPFSPWDDYLDPLSVVCAIHLGSTVMRRRVFENFGWFAEDRAIQGCEDWLFWLEAVHKGALIGQVPRVCSLYRQHDSVAGKDELTIAIRESELMVRAAALMDSYAVDAVRKRKALAYGIKSIALRWLSLGCEDEFAQLLKLAGRVYDGHKNEDLLEKLFRGRDRPPKEVLLLALAKGFLELGLRDLAAVQFVKACHRGRLREHASASGQEILYGHVLDAMKAFVNQDRPADTETPHERVGLSVQESRAVSFYQMIARAVPSAATFAAHVEHSLGMLSLCERKYHDAQMRMEQSVALNPNWLCSHLALASLAVRKGRLRKGFRHIRQALLIEPAAPVLVLIALVQEFGRKNRALGVVLQRLGLTAYFQKMTSVLSFKISRVVRSLMCYTRKSGTDRVEPQFKDSV